MLPYLPILIVFVLFGIVAILGFVDKRKKRPFVDLPPLSFMVPCFNDVDSVGQTLDSIYKVCGSDTSVFVIDDCSADGSREKLAALSARHVFTLIFNSSNLGKSKTLNEHFHLTKNDIVVFVDADVIVNRIYLCFLIIPFSIFYIPLLSSISIIGVIYFLRKRRLLHKAIRAW
jgi:poly-beta-1,6-N-acetyl-D-glucosamine synthase